MALDALSAYWIASHTTEEKGLNVTLSSVGRSGLKSHVLQLTNHEVQGLEEELQVNHSLPWVARTPAPASARPEATPCPPPLQNPPAPGSDIFVGRLTGSATCRKSPSLCASFF